MAKPLVYYPCEQKPGIGGPGGYLANLRAGLAAIGRPDVAHFVGDEAAKAPETRQTKARWILDRALATLAFLPGPRRRLMARAKARRQAGRMASLLDALDFGSVICHDLVDVLAIDAYLRLRGRKVPIGLMSHCPELPSDELYAIQLAKRGPRAAQQTRAQARILEQAAFARADFYVCPSKEASLAPALGALLDLPEADREARRRRAQAAWEAHYTPSAFAKRFVRLAAALDQATQESERSIP